MKPSHPGPDFIIIGAMKAGTSTLYDQLARQPGIFMSTPKEPAFFADDAVFARGSDWYRSLFAPAPSEALRGEASTHYTKLPTFPKTVERMRMLDPAPRLIYIIRNPVDRAVSHYLHEWSQGVMGPDMAASFDDHPELVEYGCYAQQVRPFLDAFGPERIHLSSLEQIKQDPDAEFAAIGTHIGSSGQLSWDHGATAQNVSSQRMRRLPFHRILVESHLSKRLRRALLPQSLRRRLRELRMVGAARPEIPDGLRALLQERFLQDRAELAAVFPDHPALELCYPFAAHD